MILAWFTRLAAGLQGQKKSCGPESGVKIWDCRCGPEDASLVFLLVCFLFFVFFSFEGEVARANGEYKRTGR